MFNKYCFIVLMLAFGSFFKLQGQDISTGYDSGTNLNVLYRNDASAKIYATPRGYGFLFRRGKHVNAKARSYYEVDMQNLKYPKEIKLSGDAAEKRRFVYGKINNVLLLRGAVGMQNTFFAKADNKAVEVRYAYSIGPTIAFAKPYYVQVFNKRSDNKQEIAIFDGKNFYDDSRVTGRAGFFEGLEETKIYPAVTGKFNLSFEYAPYTNLIRAIETGISVDYFPKALPIMARNSAENVVVTFHIGFVFGRKWF